MFPSLLQKDKTQEEPDGRDALGKVYGRGHGAPMPSEKGGLEGIPGSMEPQMIVS